MSERIDIRDVARALRDLRMRSREIVWEAPASRDERRGASRSREAAGVKTSTGDGRDSPLARLSTRAMIVLAAVALAASTSACTVYARPVPPPVVAVEAPPPVEDGYEPQYYDGYVVYYDDAGRPYYYDGGRAVFVSPNVAVYGSLVGHWRVNRAAYVRWYAHRGGVYRGYRRR